MEEQECYKYINNNQIKFLYRVAKCYGCGHSIFFTSENIIHNDYNIDNLMSEFGKCFLRSHYNII